ncbi:MAG: peptide/nickel transport system ATP-binding protein ddpF [Clostridia bacterium]|jgi:peptide/nickel transport system ATP-binding protein|nr:gsiA [Clostridiales bacterium]MDK2985047.1 peptide/nickel transport system ATP-binding protein ddpF [Clostridia bacterium]
MLKINDLKVCYGNYRILKGIDLEIRQGEVLSIVGESGTGKTTLALTLLGLCQGKVEGKVTLEDENILTLSEDEKRTLRWNKISIVFQDVARALNPLMTAGEQIMEPMLENKLYSLEKAKARVLTLLKEVGLSQGCADLYPHQLSGGEKQRVLIAMALANNPEVIILDEPTSALDAITRVEILKLLKKIAAGRTVIVVTHDLSVAAKLSQKMAVLYSGRIVELGETKKLLQNPKHPYTRGLLRSFPNMTTTKDLQGIPGRQENVLEGCTFHPRCTQKISRCEQEVPELEQQADRKIACHRGGIVTLLETRDLVKKYNRVKALDKVSIELVEGETLAVVGQSGSGKTTLAKCLMGLEDSESGEIFFNGSKLVNRKKEFYKQVQMIFQTPQECISHRLNVLDAVIEPLNIQGIGSREERKEMAKKALQEVQLAVDDSFLKRYAHYLSGGEIQRVAIARALVINPKLIIADEPTSALDASVQAKIIRLLLDIQEKRGLTMLFITHDIALARKISDRVAVMLSGRIVEEGPTCEVFSSPQHPYTRDLLRAAPELSSHYSQETKTLQYCQVLKLQERSGY